MTDSEIGTSGLPLLEKYIRRFSGADRDTRLEALLDLARRLPALPEALRETRDREEHRVHECQTPVFLWMVDRDGAFHLHADVPRESPTVRGFVSLLVHSLDGAPCDAVAAMPEDLLHRLGLEETLGMMRSQGLSAIVRRVRTRAKRPPTPA